MAPASPPAATSTPPQRAVLRGRGDVRLRPEKAKALLEDAKADGYDGKIVYIGQSDQASQTQAVTVEAMLEAVGFTVETDLLRNVADQTQRIYVTHDYDLAVAAMSVPPDEDPYSRLATNLNSQSPQNPLRLRQPPRWTS